jgi:hypothetical protein
LLAAGACSGSGEDDVNTSIAPGSSQPAPKLEVASEVFAVMSPDAPYIQALCSLDISSTFDQADPLPALIDLFQSVPTESDTEATELERIASAFERAGRLDDPLATDDLIEAGAILRARCNP